eukprot:gene7654-10417_t
MKKIYHDRPSVLDLVNQSLQRGYLIDKSIDKHDNSLLHYAVEYDLKECVSNLLSAGADTSLKNKYEISPIDVALSNGNQILLQLLSRRDNYRRRLLRISKPSQSVDSADSVSCMVNDSNMLVLNLGNIYDDYSDWTDFKRCFHLKELFDRLKAEEYNLHNDAKYFCERKIKSILQLEKMHYKLRNMEHGLCVKIWNTIEVERKCRKKLEMISNGIERLKKQLKNAENRVYWTSAAEVRAFDHDGQTEDWIKVTISIIGDCVIVKRMTAEQHPSLSYQDESFASRSGSTDSQSNSHNASNNHTKELLEAHNSPIVVGTPRTSYSYTTKTTDSTRFSSNNPISSFSTSPIFSPSYSIKNKSSKVDVAELNVVDNNLGTSPQKYKNRPILRYFHSLKEAKTKNVKAPVDQFHARKIPLDLIDSIEVFDLISSAASHGRNVANQSSMIAYEFKLTYAYETDSDVYKIVSSLAKEPQSPTQDEESNNSTRTRPLQRLRKSLSNRLAVVDDINNNIDKNSVRVLSMRLVTTQINDGDNYGNQDFGKISKDKYIDPISIPTYSSLLSENKVKLQEFMNVVHSLQLHANNPISDVSNQQQTVNNNSILQNISMIDPFPYKLFTGYVDQKIKFIWNNNTDSLQNSLQNVKFSSSATNNDFSKRVSPTVLHAVSNEKKTIPSRNANQPKKSLLTMSLDNCNSNEMTSINEREPRSMNIFQKVQPASAQGNLSDLDFTSSESLSYDESSFNASSSLPSSNEMLFLRTTHKVDGHYRPNRSRNSSIQQLTPINEGKVNNHFITESFSQELSPSRCRSSSWSHMESIEFNRSKPVELSCDAEDESNIDESNERNKKHSSVKKHRLRSMSFTDHTEHNNNSSEGSDNHFKYTRLSISSVSYYSNKLNEVKQRRNSILTKLDHSIVQREKMLEKVQYLQSLRRIIDNPPLSPTRNLSMVNYPTIEQALSMITIYQKHVNESASDHDHHSPLEYATSLSTINSMDSYDYPASPSHKHNNHADLIGQAGQVLKSFLTNECEDCFVVETLQTNHLINSNNSNTTRNSSSMVVSPINNNFPSTPSSLYHHQQHQHMSPPVIPYYNHDSKQSLPHTPSDSIHIRPSPWKTVLDHELNQNKAKTNEIIFNSTPRTLFSSPQKVKDNNDIIIQHDSRNNSQRIVFDEAFTDNESNLLQQAGLSKALIDYSSDVHEVRNSVSKAPITPTLINDNSNNLTWENNVNGNPSNNVFNNNNNINSSTPATSNSNKHSRSMSPMLLGAPPIEFMDDFTSVMHELQEIWNCEFQSFEIVKKLAQSLVQREQTWQRLINLRKQEESMTTPKKEELYDIEF